MNAEPGAAGSPPRADEQSQPAQRQAVVAGDLTIDWHISRTATAAPGDTWSPSLPTRARTRAGGVALVADLLRELAATHSSDATPPWTVDLLTRTPAILRADDRSLHHAYALWEPFRRQRGGTAGGHAWRVKGSLGLDRAGLPAEPPDPGAACADLVVLDDAALGFRDADPRHWPAALTSIEAETAARPWVILKMARPVATGPLWDRLIRTLADRLIVVLTANDLRLTEVQVSRELSWERTAQDLYRALLESWQVNALARCAHVVVSFGPDGALHLAANPQSRPGCTLYFDPEGIEGAWRLEYPGAMIGYTTCLVGGLAHQVMRDPTAPAIGAGIQHGIAAARELHHLGYDPEHDDPDEFEQVELAFPTRQVAVTIAAGATPCAEVAVPYTDGAVAGGTGRAPRTWTILETRYASGLDGLAEQIVLDGPRFALQGVPQGRFGALLTVDRREIESFRAVRALVLEYESQNMQRPLSVAVFGAPGSGKSFAVKQIAGALLPGRVQELTVNLSQIGDPAGLRQAFHRVRDAGLSGRLPLVFWDEFDCSLGEERLGWLRHFLAPMQDGEFQEGQLVHPLGRAIFVFAGGTCHNMAGFTHDLESDEARAVKLPDFVSRLRGFVDILGPNPEGNVADDPYYVLRRAIVLRVTFERVAPRLFQHQDGVRRLRIDRGVLRALLRTRTYYHGARSMEAIITMSRLGDISQFERSSLPAEAQLALHVDADDFGTLLRQVGMGDELLETLAAAAHDQYCAGLRARGFVYGSVTSSSSTPPTSSALVPYADLPLHEKEQNRANVRDIAPKLAEIGYAITRGHPDETPVELPAEVLERLSELEHARWTRAKLVEGWRWGPAPRSDPNRTHPAMQPWQTPPEQVGAWYPFGEDELKRLGAEALPEGEKEKDRDLTRGIPAILAQAKLTITPLDPIAHA